MITEKASRNDKSSDSSKEQDLQRRLSNYLKTYRMKNDLPPKEVASQLGYALSRYYKLESESNPYDRFISSISFLTKLAKLNGHSFSEFCHYLERGSVPDNSHSNTSWKSRLVSIFDQINTKTLRSFVRVASVESKEEKEDLETILNLCIAIQKGEIDRSVSKNILDIIKALEERR